MHISEGVLTWQVLATGGVFTIVGTAIGLKKIDYDRIARVGLLSATFFVASLIHVPIGPANVHLTMNGIVGLLLGWGAFPAILVGLILQAVFFQYGGLTTLGVNTVSMALPAVICFYLFRSFIHSRKPWSMAAAFGCGFGAVILSVLTVALALVFSEENFLEIASLAVIAHLPVSIIEGIMATFCVSFIKKVHPVMLLGFNNPEIKPTGR